MQIYSVFLATKLGRPHFFSATFKEALTRRKALTDFSFFKMILADSFSGLEGGFLRGRLRVGSRKVGRLEDILRSGECQLQDFALGAPRYADLGAT